MSNQGDGAPGRKPEYIAWTVRDTQDGKGFWNRVGAAWSHKDGQGYELSLDSVPIDGRITLRERREERMQDYDDQRAEREPRQRSNGRSRSRGYER